MSKLTRAVGAGMAGIAGLALTSCTTSPPPPTVVLHSASEARQHLQHKDAVAKVADGWEKCTEANPADRGRPEGEPSAIADGIEGLNRVASAHEAGAEARCAQHLVTNQAAELRALPKPGRGQPRTDYDAAQADIPVLDATARDLTEVASRAELRAQQAAREVDATLRNQAPIATDAAAASQLQQRDIAALVAQAIEAHTRAAPPAATRPNVPGASPALVDAVFHLRDAARETALGKAAASKRDAVLGVQPRADEKVPSRPLDGASLSVQKTWVLAVLDKQSVAKTADHFGGQAANFDGSAQAARDLGMTFIDQAAPNVTSSSTAKELYVTRNRDEAKQDLGTAERAPTLQDRVVNENPVPEVDGAQLYPAVPAAQAHLQTAVNKTNEAKHTRSVSDTASRLSETFNGRAGTIGVPDANQSRRDAAELRVAEGLADGAALRRLDGRLDGIAVGLDNQASAERAELTPLAQNTARGSTRYLTLESHARRAEAAAADVNVVIGQRTEYDYYGRVTRSGSGLEAYQQDLQQAVALMYWLEHGGYAPPGTPPMGSAAVTFEQIGDKLERALDAARRDGPRSSAEISALSDTLTALGLDPAQNRTARSLTGSNRQALDRMASIDFSDLGKRRDADASFIPKPPSGFSDLMEALRAAPSDDKTDLASARRKATDLANADRTRQQTILNNAPEALRRAFTTVRVS